MRAEFRRRRSCYARGQIMIIADEKYGEFDVTLGDDGTMDTVIIVDSRDIVDAELEEIRFSTEYGAMFRDDEGTMTGEGFAELAEEAVDVYIEQYCL